MGGHFYSDTSRSTRAQNSGYFKKSFEEISTQTKEKRVHEKMNPKGVNFRECRDSQVHPNTLPVIFALDVTGSMGVIPNMMIKEGLPTLMSSLIAKIPDVSLLFMGVGDHEYDDGPLQVAQFESGDEQLDMWLERLWLEKGGGGNGGESYALPWYFASKHVVTDAWEKRGQKGYIITCGDEPCLTSYPASALREIMGESFSSEKTHFSAEELYEEASKNWNIHHIDVRGRSYPFLKELLKENHHSISDYTKVVDKIVEIVNLPSVNTTTPLQTSNSTEIKISL